MVSLRQALALALALVPAAAAAAPALSAPPAARDGKELPPPPLEALLTVTAGRVALVQGEEIRTLTRVSPRRSVSGEAYAEVGALGEIELSWPGVASLRVRGPAAFEWTPKGELRVLRARRIELEVRRGARQLALPAGWSLSVAHGALGAEETTAGDWIVDHRGGTDIALQRNGEPAGSLASGARVRLSTR